jgi:lipid II isoglutaminyl synthase (glutamine-hydrolysing)
VIATLRICHLYPRELNIYADRGNIAVLARRCQWRGVPVEITELGLGESIDPGRFDLFYLGGGQDRDQSVVAEDLLATKSERLVEELATGASMLAVCGGYQLAGAGYTGVDGSRMPGAKILDVDTIAGSTRLIGNLAIDVALNGESSTVVGFENHAGRTRLGPLARPFGRVLAGHGNNGDDGGEGAIQGRAIGTYLHGPLLPKNPWLADVLIGWGLEHALGAAAAPELSPLDDELERTAHVTALQRATNGATQDRALGRRWRLGRR